MMKITNYKLQIEDYKFKIAYARVSQNQPKLESRFANSQIRKVEDSKLQIADWAAKILKKIIPNGYLPMAIPLMPKKPTPNDYSNNHLTPNTLITLPQYLKKSYRFWNTNIDNEIRSSFNLELYEKVCEARGIECGVEIER